MAYTPDEAIYRFLDTNGDGTGTQNAIGDYSVTPEEFYFQPELDTDVHRLIIHMEDTTGANAVDYGNITGGLTNGYTLRVLDTAQAEVTDLCDNTVIQTNAGIGRFCYDVDLKTWGAGNEFIQARWTFARAGHPLFIAAGYRLSITFNDDLTGLIEHFFMIQGYQHRDL